MEIQLTPDQVLALAPDTASAAAGKKQSQLRLWKNLGMGAEALWGECQGSALYQVKVELTSLTTQCSCPSRKFPCKHSLGLLLLMATDRSVVPAGEPPEWVTSWLAKRQASSARKQERATQVSEEKKSSSTSPGKSAEKRLASVQKGLEGLDLWLNDLMRQGLASVQTQPVSFWEHQAARLRDAQAGALDPRVRRLAAVPGASPDWPEKLLAELGKLALLTHAFRRTDQLEPGLREEVRQLIGWNLTQDEVNARGETVEDDWLVVGEITEEENRNKTRRTWLLGLRSQRPAMILQFSFAGQPFPENFTPGSHQPAVLTFWPGAYPRRAQVGERREKAVLFTGGFPGVESIDVFLCETAAALTRQPWLDRFLCVVRDVVPLCDEDGQQWLLCDSKGDALPLAGRDHWLLLALSGGYPVDLAAEWDGETLHPLGVMAAGAYTRLGGVN